MFNYSFVPILVFIFFQIVKIQPIYTENRIECRIYNRFYKEYIYARHKSIFYPNRAIFLWKDISFSIDENDQNEDLFDSDPSGTWYFESVPDRFNTYYIRNKKYPIDYLKGSEKYQDIFGHKNHDVFIAQQNKPNEDGEFFMWLLEKEHGSKFYRIRNVKLGKLLYGRQDWFTLRSIFNSMLVSIWKNDNDKTIESNQQERFDWVLKCRDNEFPRIRDLTVQDI